MRRKVKLTRDQKDLVRSVPGLAERAARAVVKRFGLIRPFDVLVASAHYGIALAAENFDAAAGKTFQEWAFWKAVRTILDDARADQRQRAHILAARLAAVEFMRHEHRPPRDDDATVPEEQLRGELDAYKAGLLASMLKGVAAVAPTVGGEDDMLTRIDAGRAAVALKEVCEDLRPEQRELLACNDEAALQALSEKWGKSWWTLGRARNKLLKVVGARLAGRGMVAMPDWDDDVWRVVAGHAITMETVPHGETRP